MGHGLVPVLAAAAVGVGIGVDAESKIPDFGVLLLLLLDIGALGKGDCVL